MSPALLALTLALGPEAPVNVNGELVHPSRLMVKGLPVARALPSNAKVLKRLPEINWTVVETDPGKLVATKNALEAEPGVEAVTFDRAAQLAYTPNDSLWPDEWHMRTIKADLAWDSSKGNSSTIVALIDTGCLVTHPDLAGNIWTNSGEVAGNGLDDDNNGYSDDVNGYDFVYNTGSPTDTLGHGSACAGLIGAVQDNSIGVTGVCPRVRIMTLKTCNDSGYLFDSYLVPAYVYGANMGARVFSMSYFSDRVSQSEKDAMDYAVKKGVLPIAAAGNDYSVVPYFPGSYENVLAVAATDSGNFKAGFSNYGTWVDVAAPGVGLTTTSASGGYQGFGGTSGACPHVAGAAALLMGARPAKTAQQVRNALEDTATPLNQPPYGEYANYGLLNVQAALQRLMTGGVGTKPIRLRYIANYPPAGLQQVGLASVPLPTTRIYGRGFLGVANLRVTRDGASCKLLAVTRDSIDAVVPSGSTGPVKIWNGQTQLAAAPAPPYLGATNPLNEASSPGSSVTGDFYSTIRNDGVTMKVEQDGSGTILMQGVMRAVRATNKKLLAIRRNYALAGGQEAIQVYDWTTGSYPYGSWITVWSGAAETTMKTTIVPLPGIANDIDHVGSVYVRVYTTGTPAGSRLQVDSFALTDRR